MKSGGIFCFIRGKMSRLTVSQIFNAVAATVNQEANGPAATSTEHSLWLAFLNRGVREWAETNDWEILKKTFNPGVTGISWATVSLPGDYKKLAESPRVYSDGDTEGGVAFPEVLEEERGIYNYTDKYIYETGDPSTGFSMIFHPGTLSSGASVLITYFSIPTSLASPAQQPLVLDSEYLIDRTIAYIFEARSDPRYQAQETKSRERLLQMVEDSNLTKYNSYSNPNYVSTSPLRKMGFRMGRD